jgi:DNA-binding CsgD family transcriptional regulator
MSARMHEELFAQLTPREMQCLEGVRDREDVRDISDRLGITINTVNTYLDSARKKLGARNRNTAVRMLLEYEAGPPLKSISAFAGMEEAPQIAPPTLLRGAGELHEQTVLRDGGAFHLEPRRRSLPMPFSTRERRRNDYSFTQLLGLIASVAAIAVLIAGVLIQSLLGLGALKQSLHHLF